MFITYMKPKGHHNHIRWNEYLKPLKDNWAVHLDVFAEKKFRHLVYVFSPYLVCLVTVE